MVIILFDTNAKQNLYPLTQARAVADIRYGIFSVKERWEVISGLPAYIQAEDYLAGLYEAAPEDEYLYIDASLKDEDDLRPQILSLQTGEVLRDDNGIIACRTNTLIETDILNKPGKYFTRFIEAENVARLQYPWQLFLWNEEQLRKDFLLLFARSTGQPLPATITTNQPENIIVEEGAVVEHCIINASTGPVYIGKNATIMEGAMLRGPIALCECATLKMGAKIYGASTIGPYCIAGGEIKNSILQSHSNKAHDGYLGDSVIGSWCNLGAGTSNSNIKNTAGAVNIFHKAYGINVNAGRKFGVIMGDYSRTAIHTSLNTGTIIGTCCNVFGEGLMPRIVEDFTWGAHQSSNYKFEKAMEHVNNWKELKGEKLSSAEISVLKYIFDRRL
ncbi:putative sugar nucleotidyl transferase [Parafilimonas sp.]|uniref:putative sugar nucleotidyl transferase n=1 Tax=Parafilimonas sp. TaxID=1969739 RepID=UPI0039E704E4